MRLLFLWLLYGLLLKCEVTYAQWQLQIESAETEKEILKPYLRSTKYENKDAAQQGISTLVESLQEEGYFHAYAEPLPSQDSLIYRVGIYAGDPFRWAYLDPGNVDPVLQAKSGYREHLFLRRPFRYADFQHLVSGCLEYAEDHGFPFASVRLKQIEMHEQEISATLDYQPGPLIRFGEVNITGTDKIHPEFLEAYLGIRTGTLYSEKKIEQIAARLQLLPYLSLTGPVKTQFQNEVADVYLSVITQPASQVDGILSFLPDAGSDGKTLLLTGELNILLRNLARSGKTFSLQWQRLQVASQQLAISYDHPNLFRSPLSFGFEFNLLKEDTLFLNRRANLMVSYLTGQNHRVTSFGDWRTSQLTGESSASTNETFSGLADVSVQGGGVRYEWNRVDRWLFPRRGYTLSVTARGGKKTVLFWMEESLQNDQLVYQKQTSPQWAGELSFAQYYMLGPNLSVYHRLQGSGLLDKQPFLNEMYRLGGLKSLRGFTDNLFFASQYATSNTELRWLLEPKKAVPSYLFTFYDQGWVRQQHQDSTSRDLPLGIGAGISISTQAGLFSLAYALGKSQHQTMNINSSKVHFGYISRF